MHLADKQYLELVTTKKQDMHDLKSNFDKFHTLTKHYLSDALNAAGNVQLYRIHDLHCLNDVKFSGLNNCTLTWDAGLTLRVCV